MSNNINKANEILDNLTEETAIKFAEWMHDNATKVTDIHWQVYTRSIKQWFYRLDRSCTYTSKELWELYKQTLTV